MKIYILQRDWAFEGTEILAAYKSLKTAEKAMRLMEENPNEIRGSDISYGITELEVIK